MEFPIVNISKLKWSEDPLNHILFDKFIYNDNDCYFKEFLEDHLFCDCKGKLYKVKSKISPTQWWRKAFKFLPNIYKIEIVFVQTGKYLELNELKQYLIERISEYPKDKYTNKWISFLKNAKTYRELLGGTIQ